MNRRLCVAALLLLPAVAHAQGNPGPFGGLFGRTPERVGREFTALELRNALAGQYDDALFVDQVIPEGNIPTNGTTAGVNAIASFDRHTDRLQLGMHGGATYQEFYREPRFGATTYDGSLRARGNVTNRLQLDGRARYLRSPFFRLVPNGHAAGPAVVVPGDPFYARRLLNDSYDVTGGFTSRYSKHSTLTASVSQRETRFLSSRDNDYTSVRAEGRWTRQLSRSLSLHAGYGQERIKQSAFADARYIHEIIDVGVDFSKQLSFSDRASVGINTQTSVVHQPLTGHRYRLNGSLSFSKYFGRTGHFGAAVSRNTEFLPGFLEPLLSDGASASISGMLSPRWEWYSTLVVAHGRFGFDSPDEFLNGTLLSRLNFAVTSRLGLYAQYGAYYYRLPETPTSIVLLGEVSRQAFTVGINTWIPIINRVKVPRDPE